MRLSPKHNVHFTILRPKLDGNFCSHWNIRNENETTIRMIRNLVQKFETTGTTSRYKRFGRPSTSRKLRTPWAVYSKAVGSIKFTQKSLHLRPCKIHIVQALKPSADSKRLHFADKMPKRFSSFHKILSSDEAHFHLNNHVNWQNWR